MVLKDGTLVGSGPNVVLHHVLLLREIAIELEGDKGEGKGHSEANQSKFRCVCVCVSHLKVLYSRGLFCPVTEDGVFCIVAPATLQNVIEGSKLYTHTHTHKQTEHHHR